MTGPPGHPFTQPEQQLVGLVLKRVRNTLTAFIPLAGSPTLWEIIRSEGQKRLDQSVKLLPCDDSRQVFPEPSPHNPS